MSPIQQMLLGVGAVATKTYVDDVFSTYVYEGDGNSSRNITNNIDLLTEGGLVWYKSRSAGKGHRLVDTERGVTKVIESNDSNAEAVEATGLKAFLTNGFTVGSDDTINESGGDQASWSFRKAPGFFTCLTYVGNGSNRTISHDLGCVPGMIILKNLDASDHWVVYHRGNADSNNAAHYSLRLNTTAAKADWFNYFQDTLPTATEFTLGTDSDSNGNGENFIAYLFAGGESTNTSRSVDFDGSGDYLSLASTADLSPGTGDFTFEAWIKPDTWRSGYYDSIWTTYQSGTNSGLMITSNGSNFVVREAGVTNHLSIDLPPLGQWTHVAVTRSSSTIRIFINGTLKASASNSTNFATAITSIGSDGSGADFNGKISNLRFVKGTAVYTSSFKPPTAPLTNITNTKLLCCNNSSTTGSTVTPGTITANGDPTASTDSPFDDPAGFAFGDAGDQNVIKCGSYVGNGSTDGPDVFLGWEPSWVLIKNSSTAKEWKMLDSMRGLPTGSGDNVLIANSSEAETGSLDNVDLTSTGFKLTSNNSHYNTDGDTYIYMCIRRSDGYVGKPPSLGSDCFAMDTQIANGYPMYISNFAVDYALHRDPTYSGTWEGDWFSVSRLQGPDTLITNGNGTEQSGSWQHWDYNNGFGENGSTSYTDWQAWMFKRHAGFDVVTYIGDGVSGRQIPHSLNKTVEMMWVKSRDSSGNDANWQVYHKGLGPDDNDPEGWNLHLNTNQAENWNNYGRWNKTLPTSTHFTLGNYDGVNKDGDDYIAMLFASVDGISKVGYYAGSNSTQTITTGFQPRFVIIKNITESGSDWAVFDTVRGWGSGVDERLKLNSNAAQNDDDDVGAPTSTGFTVNNIGFVNESGANYIYYCHA